MHGGVVVLGSAFDGKVLLAAKVSKELTARFKAGDIIREIARIAGGSGGGRPDFAQASSKDVAQLPAALAKARAMLGE